MGGPPDLTASNAGGPGRTRAEPSVLACAATGIVGHIERHKGDVDRIFGHAGIAPEMAGSPTLKLSLNAYCRLFEVSARLTRNDNFGLWFGNKFEARDLGLWGYAAVSAATLGHAVETLVDLFPLHQESSSMAFIKGTDGLQRLEYRIEAPDIIERRQDAELSLGMFLNLFRECLGPMWAPVEVHFEHPKPEGWREHEQAFSAPVFFSQPTNALLFRSDVLARPMPARDARLMAAMQMCLQRLNERTPRCANVADNVRTAIRAHLPDGPPSFEMIAAELRLPPSVIARELQMQGTNFKELVELTRRELALSYIRQRRLPLSEIALLLGYSELSAFSRAVRRWTGHSPRELRGTLADAAGE